MANSYRASFTSCLALLALLLGTPNASATCGTPAGGGETPTATDALYVLQSAVGGPVCTLAACDATGDCAVTASDALAVLFAAVGGDSPLLCNAACPTTIACTEALAAVCNGTCPVGTACVAADSGALDDDPRVTLCHGEPGVTSTVSQADLAVHLGHGDTLGECGAQAPTAATSNGDVVAGGEVFACNCAPIQTSTTLAPGTTTTTTTTTTTSTSVTLPAPPADDADNDGLVDMDDPCPDQPLNECFGDVAIDGTTATAIRLNADAVGAHSCSGERTDCSGRTWAADFGFNLSAGGSVCDISVGALGCPIRNVATIFGCSDAATQDLFICEHFDRAAEPNLIYSFDVADGRYLINLLFANTFLATNTAGTRVFDIAVEGVVVLPDFDQIASAGGSRVAIVRSILVDVVDGNGLQIEFGHVIENPSVKAIEVLAEALP